MRIVSDLSFEASFQFIDNSRSTSFLYGFHSRDKETFDVNLFRYYLDEK